MKRVFILMAGIVTTLASSGQLSLGIQGTGNLSDANVKAPDFVSLSKEARIVPGGGVVADLTINPGLVVRSGINFLQSGITFKSSLPGVPGEINSINVNSKGTFNYLQVPVNVLFSTKGNIRFFAGGGPYVSFAVSGKAKSETTYNFADGSSETEKEETDIFEKDEEGNKAFKRTDFGVGAIAGVKLPGGLFANIGYQYSLSNISKQQGEKYNNRGLQLTIGYYLWTR